MTIFHDLGPRTERLIMNGIVVRLDEQTTIGMTLLEFRTGTCQLVLLLTECAVMQIVPGVINNLRSE